MQEYRVNKRIRWEPDGIAHEGDVVRADDLPNGSSGWLTEQGHITPVDAQGKAVEPEEHEPVLIIADEPVDTDVIDSDPTPDESDIVDVTVIEPDTNDDIVVEDQPRKRGRK